MISVKPKKCKGTGIAKGYGCGKIVDHRIYGLCTQNKCYYTWLLESAGGKQKIERSTIQAVGKAALRRERLAEAEKEAKERKSIAYLLENTKTACHEYIRLRDKGKHCISCGGLWSSSHQAGHFYKAELFSTLKFNENNIHGQCKKCNEFQDGNESGYRVGLLNIYGADYVHDLDLQAQNDRQLRSRKWDRETLISIRAMYRDKIKGLNKPTT